MTIQELLLLLLRSGANPEAKLFFQTSEGNQEAVNDISFKEADDACEPTVILSMDTLFD